MKRRLTKSEVLREGYIKGLRQAMRVINEAIPSVGRGEAYKGVIRYWVEKFLEENPDLNLYEMHDLVGQKLRGEAKAVMEDMFLNGELEDMMYGLE